MKKLLGISLVAVFAAAPMMAMAADPYTPTAHNANAYNIAAADAGQTTAGDNVPLAGGNAMFKGKSVSADDAAKVATGAYVKGAYNAAISAVNKVSQQTSTALSGKQDTLTAGDAIDITATTDNQTGVTTTTIKVDYTADDGLEISNGKLGIKDGAGVKTGANGVEADLKSLGGLMFDDNGTANDTSDDTIKVSVDNRTIAVDSTTGQIKIKEGVQNATDTATYSGKGLTTKGYVDESIAGLATNYATKEGVVNTVESATVNTLNDVTIGAITAYADWENESNTVNLAPSLTKTTAYVPVVITAKDENNDSTISTTGYVDKYHTTKVSVASDQSTIPNTYVAPNP